MILNNALCFEKNEKQKNNNFWILFFKIWSFDHLDGIRIKSPRQNPPGKNPPEKISLNAVEREPVESRVLNPNASEASYKPKQRS